MENIFEDSTGGAVPITTRDAGYKAARTAMGHTLAYASRMNLVSMVPRPDLTSTRYALVNPGAEYLIYQPAGEPFTVDLVAGTYSYEWFNPDTGTVPSTGSITATAGAMSFAPPFSADAVLYLRNAKLPNR